MVMQTRKRSTIALLAKAEWLCLEQASTAANMALTFCGTLCVPEMEVLTQGPVPNTE